RDLHSFPTRRSSDLEGGPTLAGERFGGLVIFHHRLDRCRISGAPPHLVIDGVERVVPAKPIRVTLSNDSPILHEFGRGRFAASPHDLDGGACHPAVVIALMLGRTGPRL